MRSFLKGLEYWFSNGMHNIWKPVRNSNIFFFLVQREQSLIVKRLLGEDDGNLLTMLSLRIKYSMRSHQRSLFKAVALNRDDFDPRGHLAMPAKFFYCPIWWEEEGVLLAFSE